MNVHASARTRAALCQRGADQRDVAVDGGVLHDAVARADALADLLAQRLLLGVGHLQVADVVRLLATDRPLLICPSWAADDADSMAADGADAMAADDADDADPELAAPAERPPINSTSSDVRIMVV